MKLGRTNRLSAFKAINIALAVTSVIICVSIAVEAGKHVDKDMFFVAPVINDQAYYFSASDAENIARSVNAEAIAYQHVGSAFVNAGSFAVFTNMLHTSSAYFELNNIGFVHGGGWRPDREGERVAVITETLAWRLFGSVHVVGDSVSIWDMEYSIVGVASQGKAPKDGDYIYVPIHTSPGERRISSVFLKMSGDRLGARSDISGSFMQIGKNFIDYYITDIGRYIENISLNYKILLFLAGIYAALIIASNTYRLFKTGKRGGRELIMLASLLIADMIVVALLIRGVSFDVWIPHGGGSRLNDVIGAITNNGFLPSGEYLSDGLRALARMNAFCNIAFAIGLAALFNFAFVHKPQLSGQKNGSGIKTTSDEPRGIISSDKDNMFDNT